MVSAMRIALLVFGGLLAIAPAMAQDTAVPEESKVGVEEKLGTMLPLDELTFYDEDGKSVPIGLFEQVFGEAQGVEPPLDVVEHGMSATPTLMPWASNTKVILPTLLGTPILPTWFLRN